MPPVPRRLAAAALLALAAATLGACNNKRVARIEPTAVTDLSGRWNDTDSRLVANALIEQALGASWLAQASAYGLDADGDRENGDAATISCARALTASRRLA